MPDWPNIHLKKHLGLWTLPLSLCSAIYWLAVRLRLGAYAMGMLRRKSLPGFVVSVGNLTAGGTGKTPAVVMLAQWALGQGFRVAVLSRGYGSQGGKAILVVSDGNGRYADLLMAGDEPSLIAREVSGVSVIVSRSRYRAGVYAYKKFGSNFFILDDGFQHLALKRDLNLVLMDATNPLGNGHLLPWGPLREPVNQLNRADAFILTRARSGGMAETNAKNSGNRGGSANSSMRNADKSVMQDKVHDMPKAETTSAFLCDQFPSKPIFRADHEPDRLIFPHSDTFCEPDCLKNRRVVGFAGIAHPEYFKKTLNELGADVIQFRRFRDHHPFTGKDVKELIHIKESLDAHYLVTTEKDWMRIALVAPAYADLAYLCIRFRLLPGEDGVFRMIRDGLKK